MTLASSAADGRPIVGAGVGWRIRPDGTFRVLLSRPGNAGLVEALAGGRAIAATFTAAPDHRACQVKASSAVILNRIPDDLPEIDRQCAVLADGLNEIGFPRELAAGFVAYDPEQLVTIEFQPERIFAQTPGPGAGSELAR